MGLFEFRAPQISNAGTLASLMSQESQAQAQAANQSGQVWGQAAANIGGSLGQLALIPQQQRQQQAADQERQMRLAIQQQQLSDAQRRSSAEQAIAPIISSSLKKDGIFDIETLTQGLTNHPEVGHLAQSAITDALRSNESLTSLKDKQAAGKAGAIQSAAQAAIAGSGTPDALTLALAARRRAGLLSDDDVQSVMGQMQADDPDTFARNLRVLGNIQPKYEKVGKGESLFDVTQPTKPPVMSVPQGPSQHVIDGALVETPGPGAKAEALTPEARIERATGILRAAGMDWATASEARKQDALAQADQGVKVLYKGEKDANAQHVPIMVDGKQVLGAFIPDAKGGRYTVNGVDVTDRAKPIPNAQVQIQSSTGDEAKAIAEAIISGDQPPSVQGLYRFAAPVRAELAKQGYNLTAANLDWEATKKHLATMNGSNVTTMMTSITTASDSLGVIQNLADQWQAGRFPILNRAELALAKNGAYGKEAASIARQLEGQITDVVSELGQVYMGGNSPTDHALKLAEKNLSADWDQKVLTDMITLARTNLSIRKNSILNSGAILSGGQSSAPASAAPEAPKQNPFR